jgi:large subunit ribosomal protein L22
MSKAKAKFISYSPYKLRPLVDVIRGKNAQFALNWLATYKASRTKPIEKVLKSAIANAQSLSRVNPEQLMIKLFVVDQGPIFKYFKPGAMGRANIQRRRFSHLMVELEQVKEV